MKTLMTFTAISSCQLFGKRSASSKSGTPENCKRQERRKMDKIHQKQLMESLVQVALLEAKEISVGFAEVIEHLQKQEHLAALGALAGTEDQFRFLDTVLKV